MANEKRGLVFKKVIHKNQTKKKITQKMSHMYSFSHFCLSGQTVKSARKHPRSLNDGDVTCRGAFFLFLSFLLCKQPGGKAANQVCPPASLERPGDRQADRRTDRIRSLCQPVARRPSRPSGKRHPGLRGTLHARKTEHRATGWRHVEEFDEPA